MGIDDRYTPGFKDKVQYDEKGQPYLSELDERELRYNAIDAANKSTNDRYKYAQKVTKIKGSVSPKHDAITISAIYNLGGQRIANTLYENKDAMKALFNRNSPEYQNAIHALYLKYKVSPRIQKEKEFFEKRKNPTKP